MKSKFLFLLFFIMPLLTMADELKVHTAKMVVVDEVVINKLQVLATLTFKYHNGLSTRYFTFKADPMLDKIQKDFVPGKPYTLKYQRIGDPKIYIKIISFEPR